MTEMNQQPPPSAASIVGFWNRIPMAIRAIAVGFLVFSIMGNVALGLIARLIPLPWSGVH